MRIGTANERFAHHHYDIELKSLFHLATNAINSKIDFADTKPKETHKSNLESAVAFFYKQHNVDRFFPIVIEPGDNMYEYFLSLKLTYYPPYKIHSLLDYQARKYKKKAGSDFPDMIEFMVIELIEGNSAGFNNSVHLEKVMSWVNENRSKPSKTAKKITKQKAAKLEWCGTPEALSKLSERLFESGFTNKTDDFERVFKGNRLNWKKESKFLAYLIYSLKNNNLIKSSSGKAYLSTVSTLINEFSRKLVNRTNYSNAIYNIKERYAEKHAGLRKRVESLIAEIKK